MYQVRFYTGDYPARQRAANVDGCAAYVEHHFNSAGYFDDGSGMGGPDPRPGYCVVIVGANASATSKNWGRWYAAAVSREFGVPVGGDRGIVVGGYGGRGDGNLRYTAMPAVLLEPLFASNPQHAEWIRSEAGQARLAAILAESVQRFFQAGGRIGFSVGHKYKTSSPNDRGAVLAGGGTEADMAEAVLLRAQRRLEAVHTVPAEVVDPQGRQISVVDGDTVLWGRTVDADADISWDGPRGRLTIRGGA